MPFDRIEEKMYACVRACVCVGSIELGADLDRGDGRQLGGIVFFLGVFLTVERVNIVEE